MHGIIVVAVVAAAVSHAGNGIMKVGVLRHPQNPYFLGPWTGEHTPYSQKCVDT